MPDDTTDELSCLRRTLATLRAGWDESDEQKRAEIADLRSTNQLLTKQRDDCREQIGVSERNRNEACKQLAALDADFRARGAEIAGLRATLALRTAERDGTEARAANLAAQLDARDPSDELAALRRQVAELSGKREAGPRKPWAGTQAGRTVAILLDGLAECATDPAPAAMVRAIRAALGMDAK